MTESLKEREIELGPKGRLVIPVEMRQALGLQPGDRLVIRLEGEALLLESRRAVIASLGGKYATPGRSLAEELHQERRAEAEAKGW